MRDLYRESDGWLDLKLTVGSQLTGALMSGETGKRGSYFRSIEELKKAKEDERRNTTLLKREEQKSYVPEMDELAEISGEFEISRETR